MQLMIRWSFWLAVLVLLVGPGSAFGQLELAGTLTQANGAASGSAEILAYSPHQSTVLSTMSSSTDGFGVQILTLNSAGQLTQRGRATFNTLFGGALNTFGVSSTDIDPLQRGFGVVALIPDTNNITPGKIGFFDYREGTVDTLRPLITLDVGFHPDSVKFSADGAKLFVVNEGEWNSANGAVNAAGSISVVDLASVATIANIAGLTNANVNTVDFSAGNLAGAASLAGVRNASVAAVGTSGNFIASVPDFNTLGGTGGGADPNFYKGIEPEYLAQKGNKLYVTLQENNAIGVFNLSTNKWDNIYKLGTITQTIDASDSDGATPHLNDVVKGLPMPDAISAFTVGGQTYLITANEGDARVDDRDISRFGDIAGSDSMNTILNLGVFPATQTGLRDNTVLGRLNVSRLDGDTNNDGKIEEPVMLGTRSFSIWNADTGALVYDSGSLESLILSLDPTTHNMNNGVPGADARSDDKGPEPEALAIAEENGRIYAFLGMERQNGVFMFDITDPQHPQFLDYLNTVSNGLISPESFVYVSGSNNPKRHPLLLAGFEGIGGANPQFGVGILFANVPEPGTIAIWSLLSVVAGAYVWRKRRAEWAKRRQ